MITMLIYGCEESDAKLIAKLSSDIVAFAGDEKLNILYDIGVGERPVIAVINICGNGGLDNAYKVRETYPNVNIMLVSDTMVSPMKYLNPVIRPISLAVRPFSDDELRGVLGEFIGQVIENDAFDNSKYVVELDTIDGIIEVDIDDILYIEANNKMLNVRLASVEYCVSGSLENYEKKLQDGFARCHRSYIVNRKYIGKVRFSENYIKLTTGDTVPLSRSCKQNFKEGK